MGKKNKQKFSNKNLQFSDNSGNQNGKTSLSQDNFQETLLQTQTVKKRKLNNSVLKNQNNNLNQNQKYKNKNQVDNNNSESEEQSQIQESSLSEQELESDIEEQSEEEEEEQCDESEESQDNSSEISENENESEEEDEEEEVEEEEEDEEEEDSNDEEDSEQDSEMNSEEIQEMLIQQEKEEYLQKIIVLDQQDQQMLLVFGQIGEKIIIESECQVIPVIGDIEIHGYHKSSSNQQIYSSKLISSKGANYLYIQFLYNTYTLTNQKNQKRQPYEELMNNISKVQNENQLNVIIDKISEQKQEIDLKFQKYESAFLVFNSKKFEIIKSLRTLQESKKCTEKYIKYSQEQLQLKIVDQNLLSNKYSDKNSNTNKVCLVAGGKNSGKSSFCLYLQNYLISRIHNRNQQQILLKNKKQNNSSSLQASMQDEKIFILDTDLGQGLYGFPGTVNLYCINQKEVEITNIGNILTFQKPFVQYIIGEFSPQNYIQNYLKAVEKCLKVYKDLFRSHILLINTCGYVNNVGEILIYDFIKMANPQIIYLLGNQVDHIKQTLKNDQLFSRLSLCNQNIKENQDNFSNQYKLIHLQEEIVVDQNKINNQKRQKKDIVMQQYILKNQEILNLNPFQNDNNMLQIEKLYQAATVEAKMENLTFIAENEIFANPDYIALTFLQSIVAFLEEPKALENNQVGSQIQPEALYQTCGFGFIKDFDLKTGIVYIISSLNIEDMQKVKGVAKFKEIEFSKSFQLGHPENLMLQNELMIDMQAEYTQINPNIQHPFILPNAVGVGIQSFRNRVSQRKSK